jgi:glycosyltransferase involved in cell wall biosynthesis
MKVWLMTVGEPLPLSGATDRPWRTGMLAKLLAARGHQVLWWTSTVDHFRKRFFVEGEPRVESTVGAHLQFLHGRLYRRNVSLARIRNHEEVALRFRELASRESPPDFILCSFPTIELSREAVDYGARHGVPVALDIRDLWPDIFLDVAPVLLRGLGRLLLRSAFRDAAAALRDATAIFGVSPQYLEWGLARAGRPARPADRVFPLGYQLPEWGSEDARRLDERLQPLGVDFDAPLAVFVGTFGRTYDLATVIEAARRLVHLKIQFVFCGAGEREADWRRQAAGIPGVHFAGWLPAGELGCLLSRASLGLAAYAAHAPQGIPNKVIEYMAAALPIACSLQGESRDLLQGRQCGVYYPAGDAAALADVIGQLVADPVRRSAMGAAARAVFAASFSADRIFNGIADHIETLVRHTRTAVLG